MISSHTCFDGFRRLASGTLQAVVPVFQRAVARPETGPELLSRQALADLAGAPSSSVPAGPPEQTRGVGHDPAEPVVDTPHGGGRPRLGVVAREVTMLPRHWDWLAAQPGGASVVLPRLVEQARLADKDNTRQRHQSAFHFMSVIAGNLRGFEKAFRALFASEAQRFDAPVQAWPLDVRTHAAWLAFGSTIAPDGVVATQITQHIAMRKRTLTP